MDDVELIKRLCLSALLGSVLGFEREWRGKNAGLRTNILIAMGSTLFTMMSIDVSTGSGGDSTRIASGIVTGIGFLGGGVIFKEGLTVRGLTTAASIWVTSAIGILVGVGLYVPAFAATVLVLAVLTMFRWIEMLLPSNRFAVHTIRFARGDVLWESVRGWFANGGGACVIAPLAADDDPEGKPPARTQTVKAAPAARRRAAQRAAQAATPASTGGGGDRPPAAAPKGSGHAAGAVQFALAQVGKPYSWGGSGPGSYDCSGLTSAAWAAAGVSLPHSSSMQYGVTQRVSRTALQPGDLMFFGSPIHHVAMYIGNGQMVEAPRTGLTVRVVSTDRSDFVGAGRP